MFKYFFGASRQNLSSTNIVQATPTPSIVDPPVISIELLNNLLTQQQLVTFLKAASEQQLENSVQVIKPLLRPLHQERKLMYSSTWYIALHVAKEKQQRNHLNAEQTKTLNAILLATHMSL